MKMNKLEMTKTELEKLKTQIRAQLNQIRFNRKCEPPIPPERSTSHRKHFRKTYTHLFKNVFNPEPQQTNLNHELNQKRHYRNLSVTPSPRNLHPEKKHYRQPLTDFNFTPKSKVPKISMRKQMKQRSKSKSQSALSARMLNTSKEFRDLGEMDIVLKNATVCFKLYR